MNEYLTSNEYIAFPFRDSASGIDRDGPGNQLPPDPPSLPANAILDMVVTYYGGEQLYLKTTFYDSLGVGSITVGDEAGALLLEFQFTETSELDYGNVLTAINVSAGATAKLVAGSGLRSFIETGLTDVAVNFGTSLPLVENAMDVKPYKVTDFAVDLDTGIDGLVNFVPGYNMEIEYDPIVSEILMSVVPGGGLGRFDPCDETVVEPIDYVASINGKRASDGGGMILGGSGGCYRVIASGSGFQLINDCVPCCDCKDYENVAKKLKALNDLLKAIELQLIGVRTGTPGEVIGDSPEDGMVGFHNEDVRYFNEEVIPEVSNLKIYGSGHKGHVADTDPVSGGGNDKWAYITVNFHSPGVARTVNYVCDFNGEYVLFDGWMTVGSSTSSAGVAGAVAVPKNAVAVLTLMIEKKDLVPPPGKHPLPTTVTVTANWTRTGPVDEDCVDPVTGQPYIPPSDVVIRVLSIG